MSNKLGSNQYKTRHTYLRSEAWASVWFVAFAASMLFNILSSEVTSPCPQNGCGISKAEAAGIEAKIELNQLKEELNKPTKTNIIAYIAKVFEKYGTDNQVKAIQCFYSESGLRTDAYNFNTNGTGDYNVPQINSIHIKRYGTKFMTDWKESILVAEKIFVAAGKSFSPWYGKLCN